MADGPLRWQYMILLANVWTVSAKYIINCIDLRSDVPWENKSIYNLYVDLAAGQYLQNYYVGKFCR